MLAAGLDLIIAKVVERRDVIIRTGHVYVLAPRTECSVSGSNDIYLDLYYRLHTDYTCDMLYTTGCTVWIIGMVIMNRHARGDKRPETRDKRQETGHLD